MASIQISQLAPITSVTNDDVLIVNDGDINTRKITYANLTQNLVGTTGAQTIAGDLTITGTLTTEGLVVDTDLLTVDPINQRIGILSTIPEHTLDIGGNVNIRDGSTLRLNDLDNSNAVTFQAPLALVQDTTYTWPSDYPPAANHVLASNSSGALSWQSSLTDPMSTAGDIILRNLLNETDNLPAGAVNQVLTIGNNGIPYWENSQSGFANPTSVPGDIIYRNNINVTTRLPIGLAGQSLTVGTGIGELTWANPTAQAGGLNAQIQFNNNNALDGSSAFFYDNVSERMNADRVRTLEVLESLGNTTLGDTAADLLTVNALIGSNLVPFGNSSFSLGANGNRWDDLWMGTTINMSEGGTSFGGITFSSTLGYEFSGLGTGSISAGLTLYAEDNTNYVRWSAPAANAISTSYTLTLPGAQGANGTVLTNDGNGNLAWTTPSGGGGTGNPAGSDTQIQFNNAGVFGASSLFRYTGSSLVAQGVTISDANIAVQTITAQRGSVQFYSETNSNFTSLQGAPDSSYLGGNVVLTLPSSSPVTNGQMLVGSTSGELSWATATGETYDLSLADNGTYVDLNLNSSGGSTDTISIVAGNNVTFSSVTASGFTIDASGGGTGSPGGSNTQVQFNDSGVFNGSAGLTYNDTTDVLTVGAQVTIADSNVAVKSGSGNAGSIDLYCEVSNAHRTRLQSAPHANYSGGNVTYTLPPVLPATNGEVLSSATDGTMSWVAQSLPTRTTALNNTGSLADGASADINITAADTYILYSIETSHAAWVTVYDTDADRSADAARTITTDPLPGSGVLAEVVTSGAATQALTPGTICFNNESTPNGISYIKVENQSGGTNDITVTLKFLALEG